MYELLLRQPEDTEYRKLNVYTDIETACKMADFFYPLREHGWEVMLTNTAEDIVKED